MVASRATRPTCGWPPTCLEVAADVEPAVGHLEVGDDVVEDGRLERRYDLAGVHVDPRHLGGPPCPVDVVELAPDVDALPVTSGDHVPDPLRDGRGERVADRTGGGVEREDVVAGDRGAAARSDLCEAAAGHGRVADRGDAEDAGPVRDHGYGIDRVGRDDPIVLDTRERGRHRAQQQSCRRPDAELPGQLHLGLPRSRGAHASDSRRRSHQPSVRARRRRGMPQVGDIARPLAGRGAARCNGWTPLPGARHGNATPFPWVELESAEVRSGLSSSNRPNSATGWRCWGPDTSLLAHCHGCRPLIPRPISIERITCGSLLGTGACGDI